MCTYTAVNANLLDVHMDPIGLYALLESMQSNACRMMVYVFQRIQERCFVGLFVEEANTF